MMKKKDAEMKTAKSNNKEDREISNGITGVFCFFIFLDFFLDFILLILDLIIVYFIW
jgi:hypothetical protein